MAAYAIQFRRGTTAQHNSFTGLLGEVTVDTNKNTLVVHDGSTTGGFPLAREGANLSSAEGSFSSNVQVGGTLNVTSTSVFSDDVGITGDLAMTGHIIPSANITYDLGSPTMMWKDIYVGPGSLYVNGKKVIEDNAGTIQITTDVNQNLKVETTGTGTLQLSSSGGISINGELNALTGDITYGDHIDMQSNLLKNVGAPVSGSDAANKTYVDSTISSQLSGGSLSVDATTGDFSGDVSIDGSLTVTGTVTTVNSETIELADNILLLNSNALGSASQSGGIEVERGDDLNVQLLWDEINDRWSVGSEDFKAATFLGDLTGNVTGNVTGNLTGDVTGYVNGTVSSLSNHDTDDLSEGTNLYWTETRGNANFLANLVASDSDDVSEGSANRYWTASRQAAIETAYESFANGVGTSATNYTDAAEANANAYADQAEADAVASAEAKDVVRATAANAYADQAEADAIASAEAKDVVRATAAASDATAKADQAETDAIASAEAKDVVRAAAAASDATAKADQAETDARAYTDTREGAITTAYQSYSDTQKSRIDAILTASSADKDTFAEIVTFVNSVDTNNDTALGTEITTRANADTALSGRLDTVEGAGAGSVAKALVDAKAYADQAEADAIASAEAKDAVRATAANAYTDQAEADAIASAEAKDVVRATAANAYTDQAETDARAYTDAREGAITTAYQSYSDTQKSRIDAIMSASTSDADTFAEIVSLVNSVDTTNDNGLAAEITARANADTALVGRLDVVEGSGTGSVAKAQADAIASAEAKDAVRATAANAYADQAEADAISSAEAKDVVRATAANAYADQAESDAIASAEAKDVVRAAAANTYTDTRETAITSAYTSAISTAVAGKDNTDEISEGSTNLYHTTARARAAISASGSLSYNSTSGEMSFTMPAQTTTAITEGTNLYFTDARADARVANATGTNLNLGNKDSDDLSEGSSNLYFTDARAVAAAKAGMSMTHSGVYVVTAANETGNEGSSEAISASDLGFNIGGKEFYQVYLNRQLLRPTEYTLNSSNGTLTFSNDVLGADDEIEAVFYG